MEDQLRDIESALMRAAQRARERARVTGTRLVLSRNGVLEFVPPERLDPNAQEVAERSSPYNAQG
ncbi:MAG: hypothetical protein U5L08_16665 [Xanthomonadales bacterium]|nr:hypothetical protein [Xanthomonadales bacterium]